METCQLPLLVLAPAYRQDSLQLVQAESVIGPIVQAVQLLNIRKLMLLQGSLFNTSFIDRLT